MNRSPNTILMVMGGLLVFTIPAWSSHGGILLAGISKPTGIAVSGERLYITQEDAVLTFNPATGVSTGQIGQKGEGPREFKFSPKIRFLQGRLVILSAEKMLFYTEQGQYLSEARMPGHEGFFLPLTSGFVGRKNTQEVNGGRFFQEISLYTADLRPLKKIYKALMPGMMSLRTGGGGKSDYPVVKDFIHYEADDQCIVLGDSSRGCYFLIFDHQGERVAELDLPFVKKAISDTDKKEYIARETAQPWMKTLKDRLDFTFPDFFPAFRYFILQDRTIYALTYEEKNGLSHWDRIRPQEKNLTVLWLPSAGSSGSGMPLGAFDRNVYYYLYDDVESETWRLCKQEL